MNEVFRRELKYFMIRPEIERLSHKIEKVMRPDPHNGTQGYTIRSLYFDTPDNNDYEEKIEGVALRRKIRLRLYDPASDFAMLEMKQKEGNYQRKRSLRITRDDAQQIAEGRYSVLQRYRTPFADECYGLMCMRCYRPKTIVAYQRKAYIARENKIRITFDTAICATETNLALFSEKLNMYPVLDAFNGVLEIKYNGFLLSYIKDLICSADRSALSVSKYCLARSVSMKFAL